MQAHMHIMPTDCPQTKEAPRTICPAPLSVWLWTEGDCMDDSLAFDSTIILGSGKNTTPRKDFKYLA